MSDQDQSFEQDFAELTATTDTPTADAPEPVEAILDAEVPEPVEEAPAAQEPESAAPAPAAPPSLEDVLSFVPKAQHDAYKALIEGVKADKQRLASEMGRQAALQRHYAEARQKADAEAARAAQLEAQMRDLASRAAPMTQTEINEELDDLEKEFPELSKSINLRFNRLFKEHSQQPPAQQPAAAPEPQAQPQVNTAPDMTVLAEQYTALAAVHSDWQATVASDEYKAWFDQQPPGIQALAGSNDSRDAIWMLNQFKGAKQAAQNHVAETRSTENRKRLEQHVGVRSTPSRVTAPPDDFEGAFNFFASQG